MNAMSEFEMLINVLIYPGKEEGITKAENQIEIIKSAVFQLGRNIGRDYGNRKRVKI
ncbi:MAG: hypothetical protein PWP27_746 [Clostridiales bacterium]|jgi:tetrahydromethanopterin S-methyltransferase subunit G|nr:hypothetical protein [Clostridiales bacterium]